MRKLKTGDVFTACRALKKIGIKEDIEKIAREAEDTKDAWSRGFDLLWNIFDRATETDGEGEIYRLLAGPFEMPAAEIAQLDLPDFLALLKQLAAENDLAAFFRSAGALMK